ncbi:MAG: hypothetical protein K5695_00940 [Oscillospiraceae bacterium]|nr:hypothetical protein [Oscillospiraceae bacterium]
MPFAVPSVNTASLILNAYEGNENKTDICSTVHALYKYNRAAQAFFDLQNG